MQILNYRSAGQRLDEPRLSFPHLLRLLVLLAAAVELVLAVEQFYMHVKHFNPHAPIAPGRHSEARVFIALTLFILAMVALIVAQWRDPQVWQIYAFMAFNFIGIPFPFAQYLGESLAGLNPSIRWAVGEALWLACVGTFCAIYAYRLRLFERAGQMLVLSEIASDHLGRGEQITSTQTRTQIRIVKQK